MRCSRSDLAAPAAAASAAPPAAPRRARYRPLVIAGVVIVPALTGILASVVPGVWYTHPSTSTKGAPLASPPAPTATSDPILTPLSAALGAIPGVVVVQKPDGALVGFEEPMFPSGSAELSRAAVALLERTVRAIGGSSGPVRVEVRGYADAKQLASATRWRSNTALAMARAEHAAARLTRAGTDKAIIHVSAESRRPFHDPAGGPRSRTVVIFVSRAAAGPFAPATK